MLKLIDILKQYLLLLLILVSSCQPTINIGVKNTTQNSQSEVISPVDSKLSEPIQPDPIYPKPSGEWIEYDKYDDAVYSLDPYYYSQESDSIKIWMKTSFSQPITEKKMTERFSFTQIDCKFQTHQTLQETFFDRNGNHLGTQKPVSPAIKDIIPGSRMEDWSNDLCQEVTY